MNDAYVIVGIAAGVMAVLMPAATFLGQYLAAARESGRREVRESQTHEHLQRLTDAVEKLTTIVGHEREHRIRLQADIEHLRSRFEDAKT